MTQVKVGMNEDKYGETFALRAVRRAVHSFIFALQTWEHRATLSTFMKVEKKNQYYF